MSEVQEIDVIIDASGNVRLEVRGVKGPGCRQLTSRLEQLLGGTVVGREHTPEYDEVASTTGIDQRQRIGD